MTAKKLALATIMIVSITLGAASAFGAPGTAYTARLGGVAVHDGMFAPIINPAALGVGNASGIGLALPFPGGYERVSDDFGERYAFFLNAGSLAYNLRREPEFYRHKLALGSRITPQFHLGAGWDWQDSSFTRGELDLSALLRPLPALSAGVVAHDVASVDTTYTLGAGVRPLAFIGPRAGSRVTLGLDVFWDPREELEFDSVSLALEPLDGFELRGSWNARDEVFSAGVELSLAHLVFGTSGTVQAEEEEEFADMHAFMPYRRRRSFIADLTPTVIEYDEAARIRTPPRSRPWQPYRGLAEVLDDLGRIAADPAVRAVVFTKQDFDASFANLVEIRNALEELKAAGKKIYFYFEDVSHLTYAFAASVADEIVLHPLGSVDMRGFHYNQVYLGRFLGNYGVRFHNFSSHDYKTSFDYLTEPEMSDAEREMWSAVLADLTAQYSELIRIGRGDRLSDEVEQLIEEGPYLHSGVALESGVVDRVMYLDEFEDWVDEEHRYARRTRRDPTPPAVYDWAPAPRSTVALIYASGRVQRGRGIQGQSIGDDSFIEAIRAARRSPFVNGIVLRVDSPGGSPLAADSIAREIALAVEDGVPVVVSLGGTAASGGYYIAAPASHIVASPVGLTGSIGVASVFPNIAGLLEQLEIGSDTVKTSSYSDLGNPLREMSEEEQERFRESVTTVYRRFVEVVAEHRSMSVEQVDEIAQGRIWTGPRAVEIGLADSVGGLGDSIMVMQQLLESEQPLHLVPVLPGDAAPLLSGMPAAFLGRLNASAGLPRELREAFEDYKELEEMAGEPLYIMPYRLPEAQDPPAQDPPAQ